MQPIQPLFLDEYGTLRFKGNKIVRYLLECGRTGTRTDLNTISEKVSEKDFSREDMVDDYYGDACFVPVCEKCGRYVKAKKVIRISEGGLIDEPNATCKKCGKTKMIFEGFLY